MACVKLSNFLAAYTQFFIITIISCLYLIFRELHNSSLDMCIHVIPIIYIAGIHAQCMEELSLPYVHMQLAMQSEYSAHKCNSQTFHLVMSSLQTFDSSFTWFI